MQKPTVACRSPTTSRQALEKVKLRQLHLQQNELLEEGTRQVIEARQWPMHRCIIAWKLNDALQALALQSNGTLAALSLGHDGIGAANVKALAEAFEL